MVRSKIIGLGTVIDILLMRTRPAVATNPPFRKNVPPSFFRPLSSIPRGGAGAGTDSRDSSTGEVSRTMYDAQASNWSRTEPRCLSDFTGRPVVFSLLGPHLPAASVLDVGCGEGYCARKVREMGASAVVGCDVSEEMVRCAGEAAGEDDGGAFRYYASSCLDLLEGLEAERRRKEEEEGRDGRKVAKIPEEFDVAMAVFLFNYLTTEEMGSTIRQIHRALRPGGILVFSVPHPSMIYCHEEGATFRLESDGMGYFSSRNAKIPGQIRTVDGTVLNVMSVHKTLGDYFRAIREADFEILEVEEAAVTEEHMEMHPEFFESVKDRPLHLVFKLKKN